MRGYKRFRSGAWRLAVEGAKDPVTGERRQVHRTVRAPNTREGAKRADLELAKLIIELEEHREAPSSAMTVGKVLERWVENRRASWEARSPGQPDATLDRIRNHITPHIGGIAIGQLRPADIDGLYNTLRSRGLAEATVRRIHAILRSGLTQAVRWDLRLDNPIDRVEPPRPGTASDPDVPSDDVLQALISAAGPDMVCFLRLASVTGARRGQMVALRWSDLDLGPDSGTVKFTRARAIVKGGTAEKDTKTGHKHGIALDAATIKILKEHRRRCLERALAVGVKLPDDAYVFTTARTPDGSEPWSPSGVNQRFNRIRAKVPGAKNVTPHKLRHWMATTMFSDGYDPVAVAGRGGWSSPAVPLSVYGHFRPPRDQDAARDLGGRLDKTAPDTEPGDEAEEPTG